MLQCAGNGRAFYAAKQKVGGGQWHNGGMGNVEWEGVPLRPFLDSLKMVPGKAAVWLTAEGWDQPATPEGSDFAKSYQARRSGARSRHPGAEDERRADPGHQWRAGAADHPRLLRQHEREDAHRICLYAAAQSPSAFQSVGYRMPKQLPVDPAKFGANDYTLDNSVPTYGHKIKSVIFSPLPEDKPKAGEVEITGVAFNDGMSKITKVEVSTDGGKTWKDADHQAGGKPVGLAPLVAQGQARQRQARADVARHRRQGRRASRSTV